MQCVICIRGIQKNIAVITQIHAGLRQVEMLNTADRELGGFLDHARQCGRNEVLQVFD